MDIRHHMKEHSSNTIISPHIDHIFSSIKQTHHKARIDAEHIVSALLQWSKTQSETHMAIFRKLVGIQDFKAFAECFDTTRSWTIQHILQDSAIIPWLEYSLIVDQNVYHYYQEYCTLSPTYIDFFALRYAALQALTPQRITYCSQHNISIEKIISQTKRLSQNTFFLQSGSFAFLDLLAMIMKKLTLTLDDIDMISTSSQSEIDLLLQHFDTTNEWVQDDPYNTYESDILDQDQEEYQDTQTPQTPQKKKKKLMVDVYGTDMTYDAKAWRLDPVIGRSKEIDQMIYTLLRKTKSNPLLIWAAGVGKTAIVEWLAQRIAEDNVPDKLKDKRLIMLDVASIVAGTKYRGDFEARFQAIMEEATDPSNNIILFIDEFHTMIGAGWGAGTDDASQLIKPLLARGKLKLIAATTFDEYQQHIEKDAALKRRFQEINVQEPWVEDTRNILLWVRQNFEDFHNVRITDEAIEGAIALTKRYVMNKQFPDKAIDVIDEASARASTLSALIEQDKSHQSTRQKITKIEKKIQQAIEEQDYFLAADLKLKEKELKDKLQDIREQKSIPLHLRPIVDEQDIWVVLADKTGVPSSIVTESEIDKLQRLKSDLENKILWQEEAVDAVVKTLQRSRLSVIERNKPIASFLFLGASGVGKTYLAKLIAEDYFWDPKAMIRVDMSEYMESYSVSKLIGSAPWYVGYESWGMLTEQVRRRPYSVLLLDEIEKANPEVLNVLLQILDEGEIKDSKGRVVSFKSTIIVMTSNLWAEEFGKKQISIWFGDRSVDTSKKEYSDAAWKEIIERIHTHVKEHISPELRNRIDHTIVFKPLPKKLLRQIFTTQLEAFTKTWSEKTNLQAPRYSSQKITSIINQIYDPQFGARPIEKYIHNTVEPELIEQIMNTKQKKTS